MKNEIFVFAAEILRLSQVIEQRKKFDRYFINNSGVRRFLFIVI